MEYRFSGSLAGFDPFSSSLRKKKFFTNAGTPHLGLLTPELQSLTQLAGIILLGVSILAAGGKLGGGGKTEEAS
jgi:hypothetical protein